LRIESRLVELATSVVGLLLVLVPLLVGGGLGLVRSALLVVQGLPALTEDLAHLAEGDARVLIANILALLVGEEHVRRKTTLRGVGVLLGAALLDLAGLALSCGLRHIEFLELDLCVLRVIAM